MGHKEPVCAPYVASAEGGVQGHQKRVETIQQLPDNVGEAAIATKSSRSSSKSKRKVGNFTPYSDSTQERVWPRRKRVETSQQQYIDPVESNSSLQLAQGRARSYHKCIGTLQEASEDTHNIELKSSQERAQSRQTCVKTLQPPSHSAVELTFSFQSSQEHVQSRQICVETSQEELTDARNAGSPSLSPLVQGPVQSRQIRVETSQEELTDARNAAQERCRSHQKRVETSQRLLNDARKAAASDQKAPYSSNVTRETISAVFGQKMNGLKPYDWQVDVAEALVLGLDCLVIAGTGAGKSMPFVMPLFALPDKMVIIISPLNALEEDQAIRFSEMGLMAVAVNGDTYSRDIHKKLETHQYNVVITSPEMCLEHPEFRRLLNSTGFAKRILALIVDEAHCISQWGENFRKDYALLGTPRAFVPTKIPVLAASATLPPVVLAQVQKTLHMDSKSMFYVNRGTDRPNITWFVRRMKAAKSDLESLSFLLPLDESGSLLPLKQTLVFFDNIRVSLDAFNWFQEQLPIQMRDEVATYNSRRSAGSKRIVLKDFREGRVKILLTTEAAGMGCDMPHIQQVVQFLIPSSLSIWMQRAGRAGRNPNLQARAILLVQPTVFQVVKPKNSDNEKPDEIRYRKDIEEGLRAWVEGLECRREVFATFFNDGVPRIEPTGDCCDNCLRRLGINHDLIQPLSTDEVKIEPIELSPVAGGPTTSRKGSVAGIIKIEEVESILNGPKTRRDKFCEGAVDVLRTWRHNTYKALYLRRPWGVSCLLPDDVIDKLSSKHTIRTVQDLIGEGWSPTHAEKHGQDVLKVLADYDTDHFNQLNAAKENQGAKRSRSLKSKQPILCDSTVLNALSQLSHPVSQSQSLLAQPSISPSGPSVIPTWLLLL